MSSASQRDGSSIPTPATTPEPADPPIRPRRRRGFRVLTRVLVIGTALTLVLVLAGGWFFSSQIRAGALDVHPANSLMTLRVIEVSPRSITLRDEGADAGALRHTSTYGLVWDGGYGQVSGKPTVAGARITRTFALLQGRLPVAGDAARLDRDAFPAGDPTAVLHTPVTQVTYRSPAGTLAAWLTPGRSDTWAILVHGQRATPAEMLRAMITTTAAGLPSLAISYRNDQNAPQDPSHRYGFGQTEWPDLDGAVRYAIDHGAARVILVGSSMGGAIVAAFMRHSPFKSYVSAMVLDSPMLTLAGTVDHQANGRPLPVLEAPIPAPLIWTARQLTAIRYDLNWNALDYLDDTNWLTKPTLVFHGTDDGTNPLAASQRLAQTHPTLVRLVTVDDAEHVASWNIDPHAYHRQLSRFLAEHS